MTKQGYLIELLCKSYSRFSKCSLCIVINLVNLDYKLAYSAKIHNSITFSEGVIYRGKN